MGVVLAVLVVAVLVVGAYVYGGMLQKGETIYPNVYLAGVDVGGMRTREAKMAVEDAVTATYAAETLQVQLPDRTISFDPTLTNVALDTEEAVAKAMAYGREGNPFTAVIDYIRSRSGRYDIDLATSMNLDTDYIRNLIDETAQIVARDAQSSAVDYDQKSGRLTIRVGTPAQRLDADGLYAAVCEAYETGSFEPISWDYIETPIDALNLEDYYASLCTEAQDAYYDAETHTLVEAVPGYGFDLEEGKERLANTPAGGEVTLQLEEIQPELTKDQLNSQMFGQKLESRSSPYNAYQTGRTENLRLACESINGTIVNPGEVFSFNKTVGQRTAERGFQPATIYADGGASVEDTGGGVCQVSTTVYNAVLMGDYEVVYRQAHSSRLSYVKGGLDATINTGSIDFKWSNNTEAPIYVFTWIDKAGKNIWCEIYGLPFSGDFDSIELVSEELEPIQPSEDEFIPNASLTYPYWMVKNAAKKGYVYDTFKVYKLAGTEVRREKIGEVIARPYRTTMSDRDVITRIIIKKLPPEYKLTPAA